MLSFKVLHQWIPYDEVQQKVIPHPYNNAEKDFELYGFFLIKIQPLCLWLFIVGRADRQPAHNMKYTFARSYVFFLIQYDFMDMLSLITTIFRDQSTYKIA